MIGQIAREIRYFFMYKIKYKSKILIGKNCIIPRSVIIRINGCGKVIIGDDVELRNGVILNVSDNGMLQLDNDVFLNDYCCLNAHEKIHIKKGVQIGQGVKMYDHDHDYSFDDFKHHFKTKSITIGEHVWIGSNVTILKGSNIGENSVIGAGGIIKGDIPSNVIHYEKRTTVERNFIRKNN